MILAFANFKGGVGKTTTTSLFAYLLSEKGYKVLIVDMDPQRNLTGNISRTYKKELDPSKNVYNMLLTKNEAVNHIQSLSEKLDIISGSWNMDAFELEANKKFHTKDLPRILDYKLTDVKSNYDFVLIDTPPRTGILMDNAILATDFVVVVTQTDEMSYESTQMFYNYLIDRSKNELYDFGLLGVLPYLVGKGATDNYIYKEYKKVFEKEIFKNYIRSSDRVKTWNRKGITTDMPYDKVMLSMYNDIVEEVLIKLGYKE